MKNVIIAGYDLKVEDIAVPARPTLKNTLRQLEASRRKYGKLDDRPFLKNLRQLSRPENI
jgi:hypothetical protein